MYYNVHSSEQQHVMQHEQYEHSYRQHHEYQHQHDYDESDFIFEVTVARL